MKANKINMKNKGVEKAIEMVGTTYELARRLGVSQPTIVRWLYRKIPAEKAVLMEEITGIPRAEIRPDLFKERKENVG